MPYPNEHAARIHDPSKYDSFARKQVAPGVDIILGIKGGKSEAQAYRFDRKKFTASEARAWLKKNNIHPISFEPATGKEAELPEHPKIRMLNSTLGAVNMSTPPDGGLMLKDVTLLASGTWHASNATVPLFYPEAVLERDAGNWHDNGVWARHSGGMPRNITDKIGHVLNPHYESKSKAVMGDILLHMKTQTSRDVANLVNGGLVDAVSVEHGGDEVWNSETKRYEAVSLGFYGTAIVDRGACDVCKMKKNEHGEEEDYCPPVEEQSEDIDMEAKELEKKLSDLESEKIAMAKVISDSEVKVKGLEDQMKALTAESAKKLSEADAKIVELSKAPAAITLASSGETEVVEPPAITTVVKDGMVYRA